MSKKAILITGASSGFGRLTTEALAKAGHLVYASMRETAGRNAPQVAAIQEFARKNDVDLRALELDVASDTSAAKAIEQIVSEQGRLDVLIHNAGHMAFGPAEAFTPEQPVEVYDTNVLSAQRVNRAALPVMRKQRHRLLIWVSSSSSAGAHRRTSRPTSLLKRLWMRWPCSCSGTHVVGQRNVHRCTRSLYQRDQSLRTRRKSRR